MKKETLLFLLLFVIVFALADVPQMRFPQRERASDSIIEKPKSIAAKAQTIAAKPLSKDSLLLDSLKRDSLLKNDTSLMDSLHKAIWIHNKAIDDSLRADSINRQRKNGIDAPVHYSAEDSMTYEGETGIAHLYGKSNVKYEDMDLQSDQIYMSLDSSLVHATGSLDTTGTKFGTPIFKMGNDTYETDTMAFNFKTKKGLIQNVYTEQDEGFMTSEISKRNAEGEMFLYHGRYTTCDEPHPDFYFALSRAKVRPGKNVVFGPAYLVVADVPLPFAIPYGFFPFTKSYSSGFIMPTYGDETSRGFYLRDGGYYFAISDKMDLKLIGAPRARGVLPLRLTIASAIVTAVRSLPAIRVRWMAKRTCPTIRKPPASRCSGAIVRMRRPIPIARCQPVSTLPRRATSRTISRPCITRRP